ncbi:unnamed protein product [Ectocarpus sp. CCAP 1310/34]|nr:unnamed protein product [Ectocarpus sp. CCAP 1310/34]
MRMEDNRLPKRMLLGAMAGGVGYRGGQESDWVPRLGEDLVAFNMGDEKKKAGNGKRASRTRRRGTTRSRTGRHGS